MTYRHFPNFCRKKFPGLTKEIFCTYWMNVEFLPHDFCKLQPPKLYKNAQEPFWEMAECHFWADVMLRQSRVCASRSSPAQKSQGLRVVCSRNFSRATFFVSWVTWLVDSFLSYLPMKRIWRKRAVWAIVSNWKCIKAELLQLNHTQFPSLGIFVSKKVGHPKN